MPSKSHISSGAASFRKQPLRPLKNPWFWKEPRFLRPGCSIIRASLTVALMVSLPRFGSLCRLWRQQPTGLALPSAPPGWRFPPVPQNLCRSTKSKRCERPKAARNAAHSTRIVFPPAIRGHRGIIPPAAHLFAPLRQGFAPCAPKPAIKPYQQRSQSP